MKTCKRCKSTHIEVQLDNSEYTTPTDRCADCGCQDIENEE